MRVPRTSPVNADSNTQALLRDSLRTRHFPWKLKHWVNSLLPGHQRKVVIGAALPDQMESRFAAFGFATRIFHCPGEVDLHADLIDSAIDVRFVDGCTDVGKLSI